MKNTEQSTSIKYKKGKNEEIYCSNPIALNDDSFKKTIISMNEAKTHDGLFITYGKKPQELIVAPFPSDVEIARKLTDKYKPFLPNGYKIDHALQPRQWRIKFDV